MWPDRPACLYFQNRSHVSVSHVISCMQASEDALDLLSKLVAFDPRKRLTAAQALEHAYFKNAPRPSEASRLPKPPIRAHNPLKLQLEVCQPQATVLWPWLRAAAYAALLFLSSHQNESCSAECLWGILLRTFVSC